MSSSYQTVQAELERGTAPDVLCATCPWDRLCVSPPAMSTAQIKAQIKEASDADQRKRAEDNHRGMPMGLLLVTAVLAGKDTAGDLCPVFALKLSGPDGREVSDAIRTIMRGQ